MTYGWYIVALRELIYFTVHFFWQGRRPTHCVLEPESIRFDPGEAGRTSGRGAAERLQRGDPEDVHERQGRGLHPIWADAAEHQVRVSSYAV